MVHAQLDCSNAHRRRLADLPTAEQEVVSGSLRREAIILLPLVEGEPRAVDVEGGGLACFIF